MARTHSTDKTRESGGDMGFVHRGSLTDEFEQALRDLKPGGVSPVIQTLYGFHIVRVASIRPPEQKALPEVAAAHPERPDQHSAAPKRKRPGRPGYAHPPPSC